MVRLEGKSTGFISSEEGDISSHICGMSTELSHSSNWQDTEA
jgi:hypothetical protein